LTGMLAEKDHLAYVVIQYEILIPVRLLVLPVLLLTTCCTAPVAVR
jgi:hypothetical protein